MSRGLVLIPLLGFLAPISAQASPTDARADARVYVNAYSSIVLIHDKSAGQRAGQTIERSYKRCQPTLGRMTPELEGRVREFGLRLSFEAILARKLIAPYYIRFAAVAAVRSTSYEPLRQIVSDIGYSARLARKLERTPLATFDWCSYLHIWRAHGWTNKYIVLKLIPFIYSKAGISLLAVQKFELRRETGRADALQKLGLSAQDAVNVAVLPMFIA